LIVGYEASVCDQTNNDRIVIGHQTAVPITERPYDKGYLDCLPTCYYQSLPLFFPTANQSYWS